MGIANPYYGGNFDKDDWERCEECNNIITSEKYYLHGKTVCKKCYEKNELILKELKSINDKKNKLGKTT